MKLLQYGMVGLLACCCSLSHACEYVKSIFVIGDVPMSSHFDELKPEVKRLAPNKNNKLSTYLRLGARVPSAIIRIGKDEFNLFCQSAGMGARIFKITHGSGPQEQVLLWKYIDILTAKNNELQIVYEAQTGTFFGHMITDREPEIETVEQATEFVQRLKASRCQ